MRKSCAKVVGNLLQMNRLVYKRQGATPGNRYHNAGFGRRPYSLALRCRREYGLRPKGFVSSHIPGALPQATVKTAFGRGIEREKRNFKTGASG
jgi:hypothetical protein